MATSNAGQMVGTLDTSCFAGLMNDAQMDYYGKRVAAASSDNSVAIWDITDGQRPAGQLTGHEGPVWRVAWAHPKFGSVLATCGYDMKVIIWKETPPNSTNWQIAYMDTSHQASVNDVQCSPWEFGLRVACASSDGTCSVLSYGQDHQWHRSMFQAHAGGAQSLSWMPVEQRDGQPSSTMRLVTGGCDCCVSVWKCNDEVWSQEMPPMPPAHTDWVRAVSWRPWTGSGGNVIASGGWDCVVVIWAQEMEGQCWRQICKLNVAGKVEGLCWSHTGSILAVSFGSGEAVLYKESLQGGTYEEIGNVSENGAQFQEIAPSPCQPAPADDPAVATAASAAFAPPAATVSSEMAMQQANVLDSFGDMM